MSGIMGQKDAIVEISKRDLEDLVEGAAQRGAERALKEIGFDDPKAVDDVKELRSLLSAWRGMRRTALDTTVRILTTGLLGIIIAGVAVKLGVLGNIQPK